MKKIWLIAFFFFKVLFAGSPEDFKFIEGIKFSSDFINISAAFENQTFFYGANLNCNFISSNLPVSFWFGNLSVNGLSKLKNPVLSSSIIPCSVPSLYLNKLSAALPGLTDSSKPLSLFAEYTVKNNKVLLNQFNLSFLYDINNHGFYNSISASLKPEKTKDFSFGIINGLFLIDNSNQNLWYSPLPFYNEYGESLRTHFLFNLHPESDYLKSFSNQCALNIYYNPSSEFTWTFEDSFIIRMKKLNLYNQFFYNGFYKTYSGPNKSLEGEIQDKFGISNINLIFINNNPFIFTTGFNCYNSWNYFSDELVSKQGIGFKLTGSDFFINTSLYAAEKYSNKNFSWESLTLNLKLSDNFENFKISSGFSFLFEPDNSFTNINTTEKISFGINFNNYFNNSNSIAFIQKNGLLSKINFTSSISSRFNLKKISCTGKISAAFNYSDF